MKAGRGAGDHGARWSSVEKVPWEDRGDEVSVGVPAPVQGVDHRGGVDVGQAVQPLDDLHGARANEHEVPQRTPRVDAEAVAVVEAPVKAAATPWMSDTTPNRTTGR